jgi:anti-sigma B factor antagonist
MNLQVEMRTPRAEVTTLALTGEVDIYTSPRLKQHLLEQLEADRTRFVVDLNGVEYLDSTGLGVLIGGLKRARDRGGNLVLACANPRILRIFEVTGLNKIFEIRGTEADAAAVL